MTSTNPSTVAATENTIHPREYGTLPINQIPRLPTRPLSHKRLADEFSELIDLQQGIQTLVENPQPNHAMYAITVMFDDMDKKLATLMEIYDTLAAKEAQV